MGIRSTRERNNWAQFDALQLGSGWDEEDIGKKQIMVEDVFGDSHLDEIALQYNIPVLARIPICTDLAKQCDNGTIELFEGEWLNGAAEKIAQM